MNTLEGTVEEIIYKNEENGYCVCQIKHGSDLITLVGFLPLINEGEEIKATGKWTTHPDYGEQLKVEFYEKVEPTTADAIEKYLASGIIKGIGPKIAQKIVEMFGDSSLFVIENTPEELSSIKGISSSKCFEIRDSYISQIEIKQVVMFLQSYNISPSFAVKIYKKFGKNTIAQVKENPYKLADEIIGIGFKTVDKIAMNLGIEKNSEFRICSGVKYVLSKFISVGNVFVPRQELIRYSSELLETSFESIENALVRLTMDRQIFIEKVGQYEAVYLSSMYYAEIGVVKKLMNLSLYNNKDFPDNIDDEINKIEESEKVKLGHLQRLAIKESMINGVVVITGGPGTGKTTIINFMLKLFDSLRYKVALSAPTGRAAKRMSEACGREAKTIHRLLEIEYLEEGREQTFSRNESNPLDYDVVIVDEVSMVDIILMNNLLDAISTKTKMILIGDIDQLPSVGPGTVLKDVIESQMIKVVRLTEIFRQAQESMIVVNAHRINRGEYPFINISDRDFFLAKKSRQDDILNEILQLTKDRIPKFNNYDSKSIQVLSPMRKGQTGVINLNNELQSVLNPPTKTKKEKHFREIVFREGDKVMQIKNDYNIIWQNLITFEQGEGVFNGDIGIITSIDNYTETLTVLFDEIKEVVYGFSELDELELAYAVTVHKSQGCEFPVIIMPVTAGPPMLQTRNLLYTAITRAKELVVLVGREDHLGRMIDNDNETKRYSGLCERLKNTII